MVVGEPSVELEAERSGDSRLSLVRVREQVLVAQLQHPNARNAVQSADGLGDLAHAGSVVFPLRPAALLRPPAVVVADEIAVRQLGMDGGHHVADVAQRNQHQQFLAEAVARRDAAHVKHVQRGLGGDKTGTADPVGRALLELQETEARQRRAQHVVDQRRAAAREAADQQVLPARQSQRTPAPADQGRAGIVAAAQRALQGLGQVGERCWHETYNYARSNRHPAICRIGIGHCVIPGAV